MNTILLFQKKKLIDVDIFVNHPTFHFGKIIRYFNDIFDIEFLGIGVKKIQKKHINHILSKDVMLREVADYLFASKYAKINDEYGKIIDTFSNRVVIDFGEKQENFEIVFDEMLTSVRFEFEIVSEDEYLSFIKYVEDKIKKENEKYLGIKVNHNKYGVGKVIDCKNEKVTIEFNEKTTIFSIDYMLTSMEIINSSEIVKDITQEKDYSLSLIKITIGEVLLLPYYGRVFVVEYKENEYITIESIDSKIYGYTINLIKDEYKINSVDENIVFDDVVFNPIFGYCRILGINESGFDLYRIYDGIIISLTFKYLKLLEKVVDKKLYDLFKCSYKDLITINDIVATIIKFEKDYIRVFSLIDNQYITIKYLEIKKLEKCKIEHKFIKSYKSAIYSLADKVIYKKDFLMRICTDAIKYFPVEENIISIKNNANALIRKSSFMQIEKIPELFIDERYLGLEEYLIMQTVSEDFIYKDSLLNSQYYEYLLMKMCKQHYIVKLYDSKYITIKRLSELGINLLTFEEFKDKVNNCISNLSFVTINQIRDNVNSELCKIFSDDSILLNLIKTYDIFKIYKFGNRIVLSIKNDSARNQAIERMFLSLFTGNNFTSIDIYDLLLMINESFDFDFSIDSLLAEVRNFEELYYSKETERVYINKNQFYEEIYK